MTTPRNWALVLGASSGFGGAASLAFARAGRDVFGVHLDRRATQPNVERVTQEIEAAGSRPVFFNMNAADDEKRAEALAEMADRRTPRPPSDAAERGAHHAGDRGGWEPSRVLQHERGRRREEGRGPRRDGRSAYTSTAERRSRTWSASRRRSRRLGAVPCSST